MLSFGGAAGPGTSTLLLGLAVTRHRRSIIFRREKTQVRDLWDKLGKMCGPHGRPNENLGVWRGLPGDRAVELGGVKDKGDWRRTGRASPPGPEKGWTAAPRTGAG